jgi:hypothetical protein
MANSSNLPEDEQRLFDERARVRSADPNCAPVESVLTPELTPVEPLGKCDEPTTPLVELFIPPNRPPEQPSDPDLLPPSILLYSREASAECPVGQVELSGVTPYPFIVAAGEEVQEVYLDDIVIIVEAVETSIPQSELFRLSAYSAAMQAYVTADLITAIDLADFTAFDAGFVELTGVSLPVAEAIRAALVVGQTAADDIAQASAEAILVCGWRNQALWVVCNPDPESPGYTILYVEPEQPDPPEPPIEFEPVAADLYQSTVSQEDADTIAATYAAFELECLYGNEEQLATCNEEEILDEETEIEWPLTADWDDNPVLPYWMLPKENLVTKNPDPLSLDKQVADTWEISDAIWQHFNHPYNLEPLELYKLDGQEFITYPKVGTALRRTLRTRVVVLANTVFARTQEEADQTAKAQAVEQLDCFFPNRPLIVTCMHSTHGSPAVLARATALELENDEEDDRPAMYAELNAGGDGSDYPPLNPGVNEYDTYPSEQADSTRAFEVWVWPGFFAEDSEAATLAVALNYARERLLCEWVSPEHECHCITPEAEDVEQEGGLLNQQGAPGAVDVTGLWQQATDEFTILDEPNGSPVDVRLDPLRSVHENTLPRGLFRSPTYPNEGAAGGFASDYGWPELPQICQNALECFFLACKIACCEAKPDMRPLLVNEMPNYASVTSGAHSTQTQHLTWMYEWWYELSLRGIGACALTGGPSSFTAAEFDDCELQTTDPYLISPILDVGTAKAIVHPGPNNGDGPGMPARFKFGGTLAWGKQWAPPLEVFDPMDPFAIGGPPGIVKNCHASGGGGLTQVPDPWGFFSCAEGKAEGYDPLQLPEEAQQAAIARLDCTHIAWPRHLVTCPQPNQKPWGGSVLLNVLAEGSDTGEADLAVEMMLLPLLECRDMHNFMMTFNGQQLSLPGPSAVVVGKADTECMPLGLNEVKLYEPDDCNEEADTTNITLIDGGHVIISAKCCEGQTVKRLSLHIIEDNTVTYEMIRDANQKGELGIEEGRDEAEIIRALPGVREVFYIGSYHITNMGGGSFRSLTCQAYSGPVILHDTCCDGSSSSGDGSSDGDGSSAGGSFGSDSGSDKSTAIVPAAWSPTGYTALFTDESPEVVFHDTVKVQMKPLGRRITRVKIDPRFLSVCEAGNVWASGYSCDSVQGMSVRVVGDEVVIRRSWLNCASEVIVTLTGVRRGFRGLRFPNRTREQFVANEAFINSAYPVR